MLPASIQWSRCTTSSFGGDALKSLRRLLTRFLNLIARRDNDRRLRELLARLETLGAAALEADPSWER